MGSLINQNEIEQPPIRGGRNTGIAQYHRGGPKSVRRLKQLSFDPIQELVNTYRAVQLEIKYWEDIRSGTIVQLTEKGNPIRYNALVHASLYDKLAAIGKELLRYGYGRVPEVDTGIDKQPAALVVQLTNEGDVFVIGDEAGGGDEGFEDDD